MYSVTRHTAEISVSDYLEGYVDIPTFLEACTRCPNYGKVWSCPPYDFDVDSYWKNYQKLHLLASKIVFDEELLSRTWTQEEQTELLNRVLPVEKQKLTEELLKAEQEYPGSISLSAGSCQSCKTCTRPSQMPCCHPDTMRYSIESLGGNVGLTLQKLMGLKLEWMEEGKLPHHFVLVCGLLTK